MDRILLRTAALELATLDQKQVVKVAGVIRRLKNLFKQLSDQDYKDSVSQLKSDTAELKNVSKELNQAIGNLLSSIKDNDVESYNKNLQNVKDLSLRMVSELKDINQEAREAKSNIQPLSPEEEKSRIDYYTNNDLKKNRKEVVDQLTKQLPNNHDVPFGVFSNYPSLKSFQWFQQFEPGDIEIPEGKGKTAGDSLRGGLFQVIHRVTKLDPLAVEKIIDDNWDSFKRNLRQAILDGSLAEYKPARQSKQHATRPAGQMNVKVVTDTFQFVPGIIGQMTVILLDMLPSIPPIKKMVLGPSKFLRVAAGGVATELTKKYQEISEKTSSIKLAYTDSLVTYKVTKLSDLDFAKVMAAGYQKAFGQNPTLEVLGGGWAQAVLEGGRTGGGVNLPNNNVGNITATPDWIKSGKPYFIKPTKEFTPDGKPYSVVSKWRAYASPEEGAEAYWRLLGKDRFKEALSWYAAGDPVSASVVLGKQNYYTANIREYSNATGQLFKEFMTKLAPSLPFKSSAAPAPGRKPEVIEWKGQVNSPSKDNVEQMIGTLLATNNVENIVRASLAEVALPRSNCLVSLVSKNIPYTLRLRFAKALAKVCHDTIGGLIKIHSNDDLIELECQALGSVYGVATAVKALADCVAEAFKIKSGIDQRFHVYPGAISKYAKVNYELP